MGYMPAKWACTDEVWYRHQRKVREAEKRGEPPPLLPEGLVYGPHGVESAMAKKLEKLRDI